MMKKRIPVVIYYIVIVLGLAACGSDPSVRYPSARRTAAPDLPAYPKSTAPTVRSDRKHYGMESRVITFLTSDAPEVVRAFYEGKLVDQHWTYKGESGGVLMLSNEVACPLYFLDVTATRALTGTEVKLDLAPGGCGR